MLSPDKLEKALSKVEKENWMLRAFLKGQEPEELDRIVNNMHKELFGGVDCVACSNCCRAISPIVEEKEINTISSKLGLNADDFRSKYLIKTDEGFMINKKPCPFLTVNGCSIYEYRPGNCRDYPFTDKKEICTRLINLVESCAICPVVFEIFERLKKYYRNEFGNYKKEFKALWGNNL